MPIINNPQNEDKAPEKSNGIISSPSSTALPQSPTPPSSPADPGASSAWLKYTIISIFLLLLISIVYFVVPKITTSIGSNSIKPLISLEVQRMVRIGGLIDLLEKKIIQTKGSLEQAEKLKDQIIIDTLRLQLSRNLNDLNNHQEEFIAGLVNLYQFHQKEPEEVIGYFKQVLKDNKDVYKLGNAKTITRIQGLILSVKDGIEPTEYFRKLIKSN